MEIYRLLDAGGGILNYQELLIMFAVIKTGGKQYQVSEGDVVRVDKLEGNVGDKVSLDQVLMVGEGDKVNHTVLVITYLVYKRSTNSASHQNF